MEFFMQGDLNSTHNGGFVKEDIITKRFTFDNLSDISGWFVEKGNLSLSDKHYKQGKKSLKWQWQSGFPLVMDHLEGLQKAADYYPGGQPEYLEPAFYPKGRYGGIKLWLYREKPIQGYLTFSAGSDKKAAVENPKYMFNVNQNFTGWRAVWVQFEEDAKVQNYKGTDKMQAMAITPPGMVQSGEIYFDLINLLTFVSYKRHSDAQFKNKKKKIWVDNFEIQKPYELLENIERGGILSEIAKSSITTIADRLEFLILGNNDEQCDKQILTILADGLSNANMIFKALGLKRIGDIVQGLPLFASRDEHGVDGMPTFQYIAQNVFFPLAFDYRKNANRDSLNKLLDFFDYFLDQGWADGSALGTVDHMIRLNSIANAVFLARNKLSAMHKLDIHQRMLTWHSRFGNLFNLNITHGEDTDLVRGCAIPKLICILLMEDCGKTLAMMEAFTRYINYITKFAPGYSDTIKPDYSIYHHHGTYLNSYGIQTVNTLALINWLLKGTCFELSESAQQQLSNTYKRQYQIAAGFELHPGVCGRFPYKNSAIDRFMLPGFAFMSLDDESVVDVDMARMFKNIYEKSELPYHLFIPELSYSGTLGTMNLMEKLNNRIKPQKEVPLEANFSMPYSSLSVHRRDGWVAVVKGMSKYVWDFETGNQGENNLGRYMSHGALFLFATGEKLGLEAAGVHLNGGFHWGFLPGATTKYLPIEKVYFENKAHPKYIEGKHRSFSEETFAGGLSAFGRNGIYSFILADTVDQDENITIHDCSFRAHKSYFFLDDEILCLGSGINNNDNRYDTVTTLFQNKVEESLVPTQINGKSLNKELDQKIILNGAVLEDPQGIYYFIPDGNKIEVHTSMQKSLKRTDDGKYISNEITSVKAYINHGKEPKQQEYEYLISMNKDVKIKKKYDVLQKDNAAHIVRFSEIMGYALFQKSENVQHGVLTSSDTAILAMVKQIDNQMELSVADPDLRLAKWNHNMSFMPEEIVHRPAGNSIVKLKLKGIWELAEENTNVKYIKNDERNTFIQVFCEHGFSRDIKLSKI